MSYQVENYRLVSIKLSRNLAVNPKFALHFSIIRGNYTSIHKIILLQNPNHPCVSYLLVWLEEATKPIAPVSGLLAVMALGGTVLKQHSVLAGRLSGKFSKIWVAAELLLFVLVGASVNISYATRAVLPALALICAALAVRMLGVFISTAKTPIPIKERLFCAIAYLPKATVQAAIGGLPLAAGVAAGDTILTVAVLAILITAPVGALGVDLSYRKLLKQDH